MKTQHSKASQRKISRDTKTQQGKAAQNWHHKKSTFLQPSAYMGELLEPQQRKAAAQ